MGFERDQTAVIVPVPAAEPIVGRWRRRFDSSAAFGVPAHITVVYPFVPFRGLTDTDLVDLRDISSAQTCFELRLNGFGAFPGVLYLRPEPDAPFEEFTRALVTRWPEAPPYGGQFGDEVVPHLTVTDDADLNDANLVRDDVTSQLPITTLVDRALLIRFDGGRWIIQQELPFRP